jgi:membrane-associated phospholipid phosphatase
VTVAEVAGGFVRGRRLRFAIVGGWAVFVVAVAVERGVPFDRLQVLAWVVATLAVVTAVSGGASRRLLLDWLPLAVLLLAYDLSRGAVDTLGMPVQVSSLARAESALFGGELPTVWLQERLYSSPPSEVVWWEGLVALVYSSHFLVPYVVGGWHWTRGRERWRYWLRRFIGVTAVGLAIYTILPAAPPWLAARWGAIDPVYRTASRGWSVLGLDIAERVLDTGQASVNLVAALPSLHAAHAALIPVLFWEGRKLVTRVALLTYPLAMGAVLVLTGEHYVVDVIAGLVVVAVVCGVVGRWERRRLPGSDEGSASDETSDRRETSDSHETAAV